MNEMETELQEIERIEKLIDHTLSLNGDGPKPDEDLF
jgi:hypothetical protein